MSLASGRPSSWLLITTLCASLHISAVSGQQTDPISIPPSQQWDGNDGPWSTFAIQVGTPAQNVRVLPGTAQSATTVVDSQYCVTDDGDLVNNCLNTRGGMYNASASSTDTELGTYEIGLFWENRLGLAANATYSNETITLGFQGSDLPSLPTQLISAVQQRQYWLGTLALNPRPLNFTTQNNPQESLLQALRANGDIPSTSWSYTAGAYNYVPKSFGNLVIGGYDSNYFTPNDVVFPFNEDISTDTMVAVQSVTSNITDTPLWSGGDFAYIDTIVPDIWLPTSACQAFEDAFGITWDDTLSIYTISDSAHEDLLQQNPSVTFTIGPRLSGDSVDIEMPYFNFWLQASPPRVGNSTRFFPLRRADNNTQYTLGRAFLQSAHLSVDYERSQFNVSQALYPESNTESQLVAIPPPGSGEPGSDGDPSGDDGTGGISTGAIAGAAIGGVAVITLVAVGIFLYRRRRQRQRAFDPRYDKAELDANEPSRTPRGELATDSKHDNLVRHEAMGDYEAKVELDSDDRAKRAEIAGDSIQPIYEMPAEPVMVPELPTTDKVTGTDTLPGRMPELPSPEHTPFSEKTEKAAMAAHEAFSPQQQQQRVPRWEEEPRLTPPILSPNSVSPQSRASERTLSPPNFSLQSSADGRTSRSPRRPRPRGRMMD